MAENKPRRKSFVGWIFLFFIFLLIGWGLMFVGPWLIGNAYDGDATLMWGWVSGYSEGATEYWGPDSTRELSSEQLTMLGWICFWIGSFLFFISTFVLATLLSRRRH